jgi:hypothetical protein
MIAPIAIAPIGFRHQRSRKHQARSVMSVFDVPLDRLGHLKDRDPTSCSRLLSYGA